MRVIVVCGLLGAGTILAQSWNSYEPLSFVVGKMIVGAATAIFIGRIVMARFTERRKP